MKLNKLMLAMVSAAALVGCSSFPVGFDKPKGVVDVRDEMRDSWSTTPAVSYMKSTSGVLVTKYRELPDELANRPVKLDFKQGLPIKLGELIVGLRAEGYSVVSRLKDSEKLELVMSSFSGTLGGLLNDITAKHNIAFEYRNGTIFLTESSRYAATLPQHKEFMATVAKSLGEMGATDVRSDVGTGKVYYWAKPDVAEYLEDYLESVGRNSAMVTLQVAVLTVGNHRDVSLGFDWANVMMQSARGDYSAALTEAVATTVAPVVGGAVAAPVAAAAKIGQSLTLNGNGIGYKFSSNGFSLSAAIKAMSSYGDARTDQNVVLGTLSGLAVKISSGNDIPYIKNIGSAVASGGATQGSTTTDIIKSGLKIEVTPNFDFAETTVSTQVKVDMSTLVGFRELSAGTQLGTMSQPEMQNLTFDNVGVIRAGETMVVGGITYDQVTNNYTNLPGMEDLKTGSKAEKKTRNSIYIVVRPTVQVFTPRADELNAKLAGAPAGLPMEVAKSMAVRVGVAAAAPVKEGSK